MCAYTLLFVWVWSEHSLIAGPHLLPRWMQGLVGCCYTVHTALAGLQAPGDFPACLPILLQSPEFAELCWKVQLSMGSENSDLGSQPCTASDWLTGLSLQFEFYFLCTCVHRNTTHPLRDKTSGVITPTFQAGLFVWVPRIKLRPACLQGSHFTDWAKPPAPDLVDSLACSPMRIFIFLSVKEDWII